MILYLLLLARHPAGRAGILIIAVVFVTVSVAAVSHTEHHQDVHQRAKEEYGGRTDSPEYPETAEPHANCEEHYAQEDDPGQPGFSGQSDLPLTTVFLWLNYLQAYYCL